MWSSFVHILTPDTVLLAYELGQRCSNGETNYESHEKVRHKQNKEREVRIYCERQKERESVSDCEREREGEREMRCI